MTVAIVHYHLRAGGVAQVIRSVSKALTKTGVRHVILTGEPSGCELPVREVEGLAYGSDGDPADCVTRLKAAAAAALGEAPRVWHFHNSTLGKNRVMAQVVDSLAREGEALVLQLHDFAEDGRAENYRQVAGFPGLYPTSPRICYAFLNSADRRIFLEAGLSPDRATVLPNPIDPRSPAPPPDGPPRVFYPVRAIRRKNIGELLLLAALSPPGTRYAISRAPENREWYEIYCGWKNCAAELGLPVDFAVSGRTPPPGSTDASFESWVRHASHFVTTSVAEGFGMVFLEAAAEGKPVIGRNLPRVTHDHASAGLAMTHLYDRLLVDGADFVKLPEPGQRAAIERVVQRQSQVTVEIAGKARPAAAWLAEALSCRKPASPSLALAAFSPSAVAARLVEVYHQVATGVAEPVEYLDRQRILDSFTAASEEPSHGHGSP